MRNKAPTVKEIALRLKVSVSTVSLVLASHPRIGLRTRERVQKLAKKLHYKPNAQAILQGKPAIILNGRLQGYDGYETPEQNFPLSRPRFNWWGCA